MSNNENNSLIYGITFLIVISLIFVGMYNIFKTNNTLKNNKMPEIQIDIYDEQNKDNEINTTVEFTEIGKYTTEIYDKDKNRIYNIKHACEILDGHVIAPNQEFSFNSKMGNMGKAEGYKKAIGFDSNGNKIKVYGGGMCQISSTLYNAVLIADLKVTERHAHSRRVYYVPKNKDATVFAGGPDLKFINTTPNDIIINAKTDGYKVTIKLTEKITSTSY